MSVPFSMHQVGAEAMLPPREITVSEWADENVVLSGAAAAERLRTTRNMLRAAQNKVGRAPSMLPASADVPAQLRRSYDRLADTLAHGVKKADEIIASGAAKNKLAQLIQTSNA